MPNIKILPKLILILDPLSRYLSNQNIPGILHVVFVYMYFESDFVFIYSKTTLNIKPFFTFVLFCFDHLFITCINITTKHE